ncbi:MAG: ABC transporter ATP-binding protein [Deltaproteobacteria bacterium]|nr:ABC transporter ATP-binding protein [Deltaproteobacteria bacterium]MBW2051128.1 ABC transporter ATP-binding protein [Deltaproteobacteria bacterium]MBW2140724.1 ABC transporter ATP-binding protein [Deltaproteobacteria bacterium]MBW2322857.1 ABC transporter ATP-binding protein [Deltaproteobacteria bacterium]
MSENKKLLDIKDLHVSFHLRAGILQAVRGVNLILNAGETVGIVGESGSGKSVMAKAIIRLNPTPPAKTTGEIYLDGMDNLSLSASQLREVRGRKVSMIFQEPMTSLNPVFNIGQQITAGIITHLKTSKSEALDRSADLLDKVGIPSPRERLKQYPHELSGGMRQRVMMAMALSCNPTLLIADEPTTALDVTIQAQILDLLADTIVKRNMSLILISHDLYVVADACEKISVMYAGRQVEVGPTTEVFKNPRHPYTIGLKESQPAIGQKTDYLKQIPGMVPDMLKAPSGCAFHPRCQYAEERCSEEIPELKAIGPEHSIACPPFEN